MSPLRRRLHAVAALLAESRDLLEARGREVAPPSIEGRGWTGFLEGLDDVELDALEIGGSAARWPERTPPSLVALAAAAREVETLDVLASPGARVEADSPLRRGETPRKRAQVDAFVRAVAPLVEARARGGAGDVVDVGAGHGHLTRALSERLGVPVLGLERDAARVARARALPSLSAPSSFASFALSDVVRDGLPIGRGALALGLHACGELGDLVVEVAAARGASVALVGCCLQKRRASTRRTLEGAPDLPSCPSPPSLPSLPSAVRELPKGLLGLSNLSARDQGVEATREENLAGRRRRLELGWLLEQRGCPAGEELLGLNRRAARGDLATLTGRAFAARGLPPATRAELDAAEAFGAARHARMRRWALPRALLARPLEVFVALDRACHLERHGHTVTVGTLFHADVSARNVMVLAQA